MIEHVTFFLVLLAAVISCLLTGVALKVFLIFHY